MTSAPSALRADGRSRSAGSGPPRGPVSWSSSRGTSCGCPASERSPPRYRWTSTTQGGSRACSDANPFSRPTLSSARVSADRLQGKRILDLGTGPATQAMNLAKRGFDVIGTDISSSAIKKAKAAAKAAGLAIEFHVDDILTSKLPAGFVDVIIDRGVFHVLPPEKRSVYVDTVLRILRPHGWLLLKCFSDKQPGMFGPYRISSKELRGYFAKKFEILSIADSTFQGTLKPNPKTLFATFRRS